MDLIRKVGKLITHFFCTISVGGKKDLCVNRLFTLDLKVLTSCQNNICNILLKKLLALNVCFYLVLGR